MAKILLAIQVDDANAFAEKLERVSQKKNREDTFVKATNMVQILNLLEEEKYDAIITQYQLGAVPFTAEEIFRIQRMNEKMSVIVVVPDEIKGGTFLAALLGENILNATFGSEAKPSYLLRLVDEKRTRQDARAYYGIVDNVSSKEETNNLPAYGNTAENTMKLKQYLLTGDDMPFKERLDYIVSKVQINELVMMFQTLEPDVQAQIAEYPEYEPYINMVSMKKEPKKEKKKGGLFGGLFGGKAKDETKDEEEIKEPEKEVKKEAPKEKPVEEPKQEIKEKPVEVKEEKSKPEKKDRIVTDRNDFMSDFFGLNSADTSFNKKEETKPEPVKVEKPIEKPVEKPVESGMSDREKQRADEKKRLEMERIAKEEKIREDAQRAIKEQAQKKLEEERKRAEEEKQRLLEEQNAKLEEERKAREEAERKAEEEKAEREKAELERKAKEEAERKALEEAHKKELEENQRLAEEKRKKVEAELKAIEEEKQRVIEQANKAAEEERRRAEAEKQKLLREKEKEAEQIKKDLEARERNLIKEMDDKESELIREQERITKEAEKRAAEQQKRFSAELEKERRAREEAERRAETPVTVIQKQMMARRVIGVFGLYKGAGTTTAAIAVAKTLSQYEPVTYIEVPGNNHGVFGALNLGKNIGPDFKSVPHMIADGNMDFSTVQNMYEDINFFVANDAYGNIRLDANQVAGMINGTSDNVVLDPGCSMEEARRSGLMNLFTQVLIVYDKEQEDNYLSRIKDELEISSNSTHEPYLLAFSEKGGETSPLASEVLYSSARKPKNLNGIQPLELKAYDEQKFLEYFGLGQTKKLKRKKQSPIIKFMGVKDIAVLGAERGCGVTHTALMLADSVRRNYKVAVLELNPTKHMENLARELGRYEEGSQMLKLYGIDVYFNIPYQEFAKKYRANYQVLVIDFGTYKNATDKGKNGSSNRDVFINCSKKYVVFDASPWRLAVLNDLVPRLDNDTDPEGQIDFLAPMTTNKGLKQYNLYQRVGRREIHCMPTCEMPTQCDADTVEFMKKLVLK